MTETMEYKLRSTGHHCHLQNQLESENINENLTDVRTDSQPIEKAKKRANLIEVTQIRRFFLPRKQRKQYISKY